MKNSDKLKKLLDLLFNNIDQLFKSNERLQYSYRKATSRETEKNNFSQEEYEVLEAMCSRFARVSDILIQKVFRIIDSIELEDADLTIIDRINKAEKRGIIESAETLKEIRQIRNDIAHEYADEKFQTICKKVIQYTPILNQTVESLQNYIKKYETEEKK